MAKKNMVGQMLVQEILALAKQNEEYIQKRDTAKTQLKRDYYNKKIKKTSEKAERLINGLNKVNMRHSTAEAITPVETALEEGVVNVEKLTNI